MDYELIKDIDYTKEASAIVVHVLSKWTQLHRDPPHDSVSIVMILMDEESSIIEADIGNKALHEQFKNELAKGGVYFIENFTVSRNK